MGDGKFKKGNKEQLKAKNPGRKTLAEELKMYKEKVEEMALEDLAASKVYKQLEGEDNYKIAKELGLPVYLKSKPEKREIDLKESLVKFIDGKTNNN